MSFSISGKNNNVDAQFSVHKSSIPSVDEGRLASLERMCAALSAEQWQPWIPFAIGEETAGDNHSSLFDSEPQTISTSDDSGILLGDNTWHTSTTSVVSEAPNHVKNSRPTKNLMLPVLKSLRKRSTPFHYQGEQRPFLRHLLIDPQSRRGSKLYCRPGLQRKSGFQKAKKVTKLTFPPATSPAPASNNPSHIPTQLPRGSHNRRMVDEGKQAVRSSSRIIF